MAQVVNTNKCNFTCEHCLFSCSPKNSDMLCTQIFQRFVETAGANGESVNYCGGETFLHPDWKWHLKYMSIHFERVRVVTNGSKFYTRNGNKTPILNQLLEVLPDMIMNCESVTILISEDSYHQHFYNKLDLYSLDDVIRRFKFEDVVESHENIHIEKDNRYQSNYIIDIGRAKETGCGNADGFCSLDDGFEPCIAPDGKVYACEHARGYVGEFNDSYDTWENNYKKFKVQESCASCNIQMNN